ncbi:hypothetical protein BAS09_18210 [Elizabethkingia ursingii]|uniref:MBL fold metallo-hydrolase n=1 Tax=Elizabethkingia TaxID=308865 RepID=UPI00099A1ED0|nr:MULTISPECIES: MBL fold metallo-hydrolase [Elizabethkingia]MCL1688358.1 MBL fold metallo-hydrolase [Elizabethkingia anophelis]MDV4008251.1 MBL fold metallo-hydrolase [Elizabethkingia anophelis]OPC06971.1 hypothetical protein BAS09_18210 [Elizabethkingia ursingii]
MDIQKLNWAGLKLTTSNKTILIDAVEDFSYYKPVLGEAMKPTLLFSKDLQADYILFTHLHLDHFDFALITKCLKPSGKLIVYSELKKQIQEKFQNVEVIYLGLDEEFCDSEIHFKPVFAMDGIGDIQSSWIIEDSSTKVFHGGDTIWHNQFWKLGKENQNITYAFLPVNGAIVDFTMIGIEYSCTPASMTVDQALDAAHLLHAKYLVPIHYNLFEHEKFYRPTKFSLEDLKKKSQELHQNFILLNDGELLSIK